MDRKIVLIALVFGFLSIIFGAFGAHALKKFLSPEQLNSFEVGIRYMMYNAFFLMFLGTTQLVFPEQKTIVFYLSLVGITMFSGSIFLLTTMPITKINFKFGWDILHTITTQTN